VAIRKTDFNPTCNAKCNISLPWAYLWTGLLAPTCIKSRRKPLPQAIKNTGLTLEGETLRTFRCNKVCVHTLRKLYWLKILTEYRPHEKPFDSFIQPAG
jgi:hypothetical protein